jgi:hypothetical protein
MPVADRGSRKVKSLIQRIEELVAYDGCTTPPDWRPFLVELAHELGQLQHDVYVLKKKTVELLMAKVER